MANLKLIFDDVFVDYSIAYMQLNEWLERLTFDHERFAKKTKDLSKVFNKV